MKRAVYTKELAQIEADPKYSPAMFEYAKAYRDYCIETYNSLDNPVVLIEQRVDMTEWIPEGFGTCDCVIIGNGELHVIDLKYGQGVPVQAEGNPQIMLYALGALNEFSLVYDIHTVRMTIFQPRIDNISVAEISADEIAEWGLQTVKPAAELAADGGGEFVAGDHCKFCRAKAQCRARAEDSLRAAQYDFAPSELLTDDEIGEILNMADRVKAWISDIEEYALIQARDHDKAWPGWKLVEGRSNRTYSDPDKVAAQLLRSGINESIIYERILLGITKMEKALGGKKKFDELLGDLIIKPPGKPTLVPETDKRPPINSTSAAAEDFKEE